MFRKDLKIDIITRYLELITKFFSVMIVVSIIIGGISIYKYLQQINHLFLFSDIVGLSYTFVSALVSYFIFIIIFFVGFLSPFLLSFFLLILVNDNNHHIKKNNENSEKNEKSILNPSKNLLKLIKYIRKFIKFIILNLSIILLLLIPLLPIILLAVTIIYLPLFGINFLVREIFFGTERRLPIDILSKFFHFISLILTIVISFILFFGGNYIEISLYLSLSFFIVFSFFYMILFFKHINLEKLLLIFLLSIAQLIPSVLHFLFVVYPTITMINKEEISIIFYISSIFVFGISCFFSHDAFSRRFQKKKYNIFISLIPIIIYILYLSIFSNYNILLYIPRFIEKPQDSSWYIIHNGNTNSENINGMTSKNIQNYKKYFLPINRDRHCYDDVFNSINMYNCKIIENPNALYGYMALNLETTKVFCPEFVDFFETDNQDRRNKMSQKCLAIDGKYLQPIGEQYLFR